MIQSTKLVPTTATSALLQVLEHKAVGTMGIERRANLGGITVVVVGCRKEVGTFPYVFFKWWEPENNAGKFEQFW